MVTSQRRCWTSIFWALSQISIIYTSFRYWKSKHTVGQLSITLFILFVWMMFARMDCLDVWMMFVWMSGMDDVCPLARMGCHPIPQNPKTWPRLGQQFTKVARHQCGGVYNYLVPYPCNDMLVARHKRGGKFIIILCLQWYDMNGGRVIIIRQCSPSQISRKVHFINFVNITNRHSIISVNSFRPQRSFEVR